MKMERIIEDTTELITRLGPQKNDNFYEYFFLCRLFPFFFFVFIDICLLNYSHSHPSIDPIPKGLKQITSDKKNSEKKPFIPRDVEAGSLVGGIGAFFCGIIQLSLDLLYELVDAPALKKSNDHCCLTYVPPLWMALVAGFFAVLAGMILTTLWVLINNSSGYKVGKYYHFGAIVAVLAVTSLLNAGKAIFLSCSFVVGQVFLPSLAILRWKLKELKVKHNKPS